MLTQNLLSQERKSKLRWFITVSTMPLLGVVTAFGLVPESNLGLDAGKKMAIEAIDLPKVAVVETNTASFWRSDRIQRGDSVNEILRRMNVQDTAASNFLRTDAAAASFRSLPIGKELQIEMGATGNLISLRFLNEKGAQTIIEKRGAEFVSHVVAAKLEKRLFVRTGEIKTSLYAATDAAGLPESAANQLTEIFSGDVDFHHDLKRGDKFTVVYEMTYSNGALVQAGNIQAAEFINQGQSYRAVYFQNEQGKGDYFTQKAKAYAKLSCAPQ